MVTLASARRGIICIWQPSPVHAEADSVYGNTRQCTKRLYRRMATLGEPDIKVSTTKRSLCKLRKFIESVIRR